MAAETTDMMREVVETAAELSLDGVVSDGSSADAQTDWHTNNR